MDFDGFVNPEILDMFRNKGKCCDNCEYFDISKNKGDNTCLKDVFNSFDTDCYINDSDTFYCSYHKFKV